MTQFIRDRNVLNGTTLYSINITTGITVVTEHKVVGGAIKVTITYTFSYCREVLLTQTKICVRGSVITFSTYKARNSFSEIA